MEKTSSNKLANLYQKCGVLFILLLEMLVFSLLSEQ